MIGIFLASFLMCFTFAALKNTKTAVSENSVVNILLVYIVYTTTVQISSLFGVVGSNPALAIAQVILETSQFGSFPDNMVQNSPKQLSSDHYTHYLWIYIVMPICGGLLAGLVSLIHEKISTGQDVEDQNS